MKKDAIAIALANATKGLLFISESEAKLTPFRWNADAKLDEKSLIEQAGAEADAPVETATLDQFFRAVSKEDRPQFDQLAAVLKANLSDVKVYKIGETEKRVFIVGKAADGTLAGVKTSVVET